MTVFTGKGKSLLPKCCAARGRRHRPARGTMMRGTRSLQWAGRIWGKRGQSRSSRRGGNASHRFFETLEELGSRENLNVSVLAQIEQVMVTRYNYQSWLP